MPKDGARIPSTALGLLSALGLLNFGRRVQVRKADSQGWCVSLSGRKASLRPEAHILIVSLYCCFRVRKATHIRGRITVGPLPPLRCPPPPPGMSLLPLELCSEMHSGVRGRVCASRSSSEKRRPPSKP